MSQEIKGTSSDSIILLLGHLPLTQGEGIKASDGNISEQVYNKTNIVEEGYTLLTLKYGVSKLAKRARIKRF